MPRLDAITITVVHSLVNCVLITVFVYAWRALEGIPGTRHWAVGYAGIGIAGILYAVFVSTGFYPLAAVAYILEISGIVVLMRGCDEFASIRWRVRLDISIAAVGIFSGAIFSVVFPNQALRLVFGNLAIASLFWGKAVRFFRHPDPWTRSSLAYPAIIFTAYGTVEIIQVVTAIMSDHPYRRYLELKSVFLVLYTFFYTALAVTLLMRACIHYQRMLAEKAAEKELLLKEMHHRTKNNLHLIGSLVALEAAELPDGAEKKAFDRVESRIKTVAKLHEQLQRRDSADTVDAGAFLAQVLETLPPSVGASHRIDLAQDVARVELHVSEAIPLALIVNELTANALKHAFPEGRTGTVRVSFAHEGDRYLLSIQDDGIGLPETPKESTLGLNLVRALAVQLDGDFHLETGKGTRAVLSFPVPPHSVF